MGALLEYLHFTCDPQTDPCISVSHHLYSLTSFRTSNMANKFSCYRGKNRMNRLRLHSLFMDTLVTLIPFQVGGCCLSKCPKQHPVKSVSISLLTVGRAWEICLWLGEMCCVVLCKFLLEFVRLKVHGGKGQNLSRGSEPRRNVSGLLKH